MLRGEPPANISEAVEPRREGPMDDATRPDKGQVQPHHPVTVADVPEAPALAAVVIAVGGEVVVDIPDDRPAHEYGPPDPRARTLVKPGRNLRDRVHLIVRREAPHERGGQGGDKDDAAQEEHKPFHVLHLTDRRIRDATHRARARVPVVVE